MGNTLAHGHIGANEKDFLPHQPNELCAVLSTWSKPLKWALKLDTAPTALVLGSEPNFIWGVVHQDR